MNRTRIKICGLTNVEDARAAIQAGADMIGFVLAESRRKVALEAVHSILDALREPATVVLVFQDAPARLVADSLARTHQRFPMETCGEDEWIRITGVQLHGSESPEYIRELRRLCEWPGPIFKAIQVGPAESPAFIESSMRPYVDRGVELLLDSGAGSGRPFDWSLAVGLPYWFILSGGLTPENVGAAIQILRPAGVDVSSGVEESPGKKSAERMQAFVAAVRAADAS